MAQLTKGLYGNQFERASELFGLRCGQIRGKDFVHNGGWYNKLGEKLGWGDLSIEDFERIYRELDDDEMFIVLGEKDSFWSFVKQPGLLGHNAVVKPDVEAPGVDYVAAKANYIINKNGYFCVSDYPETQDIVGHSGLLFRVVKREEAQAFIATNGARVAPTS